MDFRATLLLSWRGPVIPRVLVIFSHWFKHIDPHISGANVEGNMFNASSISDTNYTISYIIYLIYHGKITPMPIYGHLDLLSLAVDSDGALFGLVI